jgi:hypothetical protein
VSQEDATEEGGIAAASNPDPRPDNDSNLADIKHRRQGLLGRWKLESSSKKRTFNESLWTKSRDFKETAAPFPA